jgi:large subunit ribosomal protein L22
MPPVRAVAKQIGASPKRLKPIMDLVRGQGVGNALNTLQLLSSPWAKLVAKVVQSAASNAENNMFMDRGDLRIVQITADQARPLKRFRPRARGRIGRIQKPSSHITVVVDQVEEETN